MLPMSRWNAAIFSAGSFFFQLKLGEQLYASILPGNCRWISLAKRSASSRFGLAGLPPQQVGIRRVGQAARDRVVVAAAGLDAEEALRRAVAGDERTVALIDVAGQQLRRLRVGAAQQHGVHALDIGRQPRRVQRADVLRDRHQHLAAQMAALLFGRELVLEMHARRAGLDHRLHQLVGVQRAAEAGFRVGDDRRHPVGAVAAALASARSGRQRRSALLIRAHHVRHRIDRIQRLVGIHLPRRIGVARDLPAGQIDRLQPGLHLLHRLVAGQRAQRRDERLGLQQVPQPGGAHLGQRVADAEANRPGARRPPACSRGGCRRSARGRRPGLVMPSGAYGWGADASGGLLCARVAMRE